MSTAEQWVLELDWEHEEVADARAPGAPDPGLDPCDYETVIVAFSGGKDSVACVLNLLERGVDPARIELWHHEIDGREGSRLMDWPCTPSYCRAFAEAIGVPIYFSWKEGGFEREMNRQDERTAPVVFETPEGVLRKVGGTGGKEATRRKFPQVSADLSVRWCSSYLKIGVMATAICNQSRFLGKRTLVVTGERAQESASRARYAVSEPHRTDNREGAKVVRYVDHWRPIHGWTEERIWEIIERHRINPHPAYRLGFGRCSCMTCIFASDDQWATLARIAPERVRRIAEYEAEFGVTIHRRLTVLERVNRGRPYASLREEDIRASQSENFDEPIILAQGEWTLPAGAFGEGCGPT